MLAAAQIDQDTGLAAGQDLSGKDNANRQAAQGIAERQQAGDATVFV